jgi:hypothetical protein
MDWNEVVNQRLLMPIGKLGELLAWEAVSEDAPSLDDVRKGTAPSTSDRLGRHQKAILEVLEKGCLLSKVHIVREDQQALISLCEVRRTMASLARSEAQIDIYRVLDPGLPPPTDSKNELANCLGLEMLLFVEANKLEVNPGEVVRWMNSVHEGQALLPASLRAYLDLPAVPSSGQDSAPPAPPPRIYGREAIARELGISPRGLDGYIKKGMPHGKDEASGKIYIDFAEANTWMKNQKDKTAKNRTKNLPSKKHAK